MVVVAEVMADLLPLSCIIPYTSPSAAAPLHLLLEHVAMPHRDVILLAASLLQGLERHQHRLHHGFDLMVVSVA